MHIQSHTHSHSRSSSSALAKSAPHPMVHAQGIKGPSRPGGTRVLICCWPLTAGRGHIPYIYSLNCIPLNNIQQSCLRLSSNEELMQSRLVAQASRPRGSWVFAGPSTQFAPSPENFSEIFIFRMEKTGRRSTDVRPRDQLVPVTRAMIGSGSWNRS